MYTETDVMKFAQSWPKTRDGKDHSHLPGIPMSRFTPEQWPALRALIADGRLTVLDVTKPNKVDPTYTVTYSYVVVP